MQSFFLMDVSDESIIIYNNIDSINKLLQNEYSNKVLQDTKKITSSQRTCCSKQEINGWQIGVENIIWDFASFS